ncbi:MAG: hypothetical protein AAGE96_14130 [Cyanobacteria bacterium P01_G01_bin.19]
MDRDLIIKALKNACGNKNLRFQVIVQNSKLYIYINRHPDYTPDYKALSQSIAKAIADLSLDSLQGIWLHSRKLGEVESDWQAFLESPTSTLEEMETVGNSTNDSAEVNFPEFEDLLEGNNTGDTGLLKKEGLVHAKPLEEENINLSSASNDSDIKTNSKINKLVQYCFVSNKKILTGDILCPDKEVIRLVRFFHHFSENNQLQALPFIDEYFKQGKTSSTEKLPPIIKKLLKQIAEQSEKNRKAIAIWLSRYCFDSETTLAELKEMEDKKKNSRENTRKAKRSNTQYNFTPAGSEIPSRRKQLTDLLVEDKFKLPGWAEKSLLPVAWTLATLLLICVGIYTSQGYSSTASQQLPKICQTSIGSPDYCRLGVNLVGKKAIEQASENIFPLTKVTETVATFGCERFANVKAGALNNLDPKQNPVISSHGEKIFPHIYVVEAVQKDVARNQNIRVGCVYTTGQGERSPMKLASDEIPLTWPSKYYKQASGSNSYLALGIYTNLINLGLYTLFSAVGVAIASQFKLGIKITNRPQTIYLIALILGIVQLVAINLPAFNLLAGIILSTLAIFIFSQLIRSFNIDFEAGLPLIAVGLLTIVAVQFLFYGICWQIINSFT